MTTKTRGYYNPNNYPVFVTPIKRALYNRNDYVTDSEGRNINDPYLRALCGSAGGLAEDVGEEDVPLILLPESGPMTPAGSLGFSGVSGAPVRKVAQVLDLTTNKIRMVKDLDAPIVSGQVGADPFKTDDSNKIVSIPIQPMLPAGGRMSVSSYSIDEARRLRLIKDVRSPDTEGPEDSATSILDMRQIPTLDPRLEVPNNRSTKVTPQQMADVHRAMLEAKAERKMMADKGVTIPDLLPDPNLELLSEDELSPVPPEKIPLLIPKASDPIVSYPFTAPDGKGFKFRSQLEKYVKKRFPDQAAEIMALHPTTK